MSEPMKPGDDLTVRSFVDNGRGLGHGFSAILLDDRDWHRSRVRVDETDVERTGVTYEMCAAYARANDIAQHGHEWDPPSWADSPDHEGSMAQLIVSSISLLSGRLGLRHSRPRCDLDTLDAILAGAE